MPDPVIRGFGGSNSGANVTQSDVVITTLTGVTPNPGDITVIAIVKDGTGAFTWPSGWTSFSGFPVTFASTNNQGVLDIRYRKCVASGEATTISITHASEGTAWQAYVLAGYGPLEGLPEGASANGDSTNPDPPNLAPSWGGRTNTLWLAFAANDGNTAITAAPTNYTNFQNDRWANTNGVGIASARRLTNGSSENPGVFTMATEQWGAGTVGFNPGIALTEPLNREGDSQRTALPARREGVLTTISVMPPEVTSVPLPVDWPNPRGKEPLRLTWINNNLQNTIQPPVFPPFVPVDYPNPGIGRRNPVGIIQARPQYYQDIQPFGQYEWPVPSPARLKSATWVNNLLENTLAPVSQDPFVVPPFVVQPRKKYLITGVSSVINLGNIKPANKDDWPVPPPKSRMPQTWIFVRKLDEPVSVPFVPVDYPNPQIEGKQNVGSVSARPQYYQDDKPFLFNDWSNPAPQKLKSHTWTQNLLQSTLTPSVTGIPPGGSILPFRFSKEGLLVSIGSSQNPGTPVQPPFGVDNSIVQKRKRVIPDWIHQRPQYYFDNPIKPFTQSAFPPPVPKKQSPYNLTHLWWYDQVVVPGNPAFPNLFPNPGVQKRSAVSWIYQGPFQQIFTRPIAAPFVDMPPGRKQVIGLGWINPRPFYFVEPTSIPIIAAIETVPRRKRHNDLTILNRFQLTQIALGNPFSQKHWPNPAGKDRIRFDWEFNYQVDENQPPSTNYMELPPPRRRAVPLTWIYSAQIAQAAQADPIKLFMYPNPIVVRRQTDSWLVNLLQSTLNPGVGPTPFAQYEWPNPLRGKRNFHNGWIQEKKFFYVEQPLQPAQYDWPVFRPVKRNQVGFIHYRIGDSDPPKFVSVDSLPEQKKRQVLSWIFSSLIDLNSIAGGKPFNQNDWPLPRVAKINRDILNLIIQNNPNLITVIGRQLCLISSATEYYLLSEAEDYNLESQATDYELDSGGIECQ